MSDIFETIYKPDVLSCLADLSNDEVFTPPTVVNEMLDMLPQELFESPDTTFLDPACKSGVFLREIAKRLIKGLEPVLPDLQERIDHIFHKQLFAIAITELTSLLSRRSVYCSKYPNCDYSVSKFDNIQGNILFRNVEHEWVKGRCCFCGANESEYGKVKREDLETHAYEFIHTTKPQEIFNMKFDVIIGNPPYHLSTGGGSAQATPLYDKFVERAKKLKPKYLTMIIPSRWFAGGMGLDKFRESMLSDSKIKVLVDYPNSKDCFPQASIGGGVCYFLWENDYNGDCTIVNVNGNKTSTIRRSLNEFDVFVRYNDALTIIRKAQKQTSSWFSEVCSALSPFGINSNERGYNENSGNDIKLYSSKGEGYISKSSVKIGLQYIDKYKVMLSKTGAEHAGEPGKDGTFKVLSTIKALKPNEVCTFSYFVAGPFDSLNYTENVVKYLRTKFVRFMVLQAVSSINLSKDKFKFVPMQDFSKPWTDEELYAKYNLSKEEIDFIESMIRPME